jgi:hypothetical protein
LVPAGRGPWLLPAGCWMGLGYWVKGEPGTGFWLPCALPGLSHAGGCGRV